MGRLCYAVVSGYLIICTTNTYSVRKVEIFCCYFTIFIIKSPRYNKHYNITDLIYGGALLLQTVVIEQVQQIEPYLDEMSDMLVQIVDADASIGFLPPLVHAEASAYWEQVLQPGTLLYVAKIDNVIAGTIQLHLCTKPNGDHRAEVAKLMVHLNYRRHGIARRLMEHIEQKAKEEHRILLVLDTRDGDPSNLLYQSLGYIQAGQIPNYAKSGNGGLDATNLYYKHLV